MIDGEQLQGQDIEALRLAVERGDREVIDLLQRALARAAANAQAPAAAAARVAAAERRLGDRILGALQLALDQEALETSEPLMSALEAAMTRFGGAGVVENRDVPEGITDAYDRLDRLRHREHQVDQEA